MSFPADWVLGNRKSMSLHFRWSHFFWTSKLRTGVASSLPNNLPFLFLSIFLSSFHANACVFKASIGDAVSFKIFLVFIFFFLFRVNLFIVKIFWWFPDYYFATKCRMYHCENYFFHFLWMITIDNYTLYGCLLSRFFFSLWISISVTQTKFVISHFFSPLLNLRLQNEKNDKIKKHLEKVGWGLGIMVQ